MATQQLSALSQRFTEYGAFVGRGDSTKVFVELGYLQRVNDSLQNGLLEKVNTNNKQNHSSRNGQGGSRNYSGANNSSKSSPSKNSINSLGKTKK